jgi:hypothetical protein
MESAAESLNMEFFTANPKDLLKEIKAQSGVP